MGLTPNKYVGIRLQTKLIKAHWNPNHVYSVGSYSAFSQVYSQVSGVTMAAPLS